MELLNSNLLGWFFSHFTKSKYAQRMILPSISSHSRGTDVSSTISAASHQLHNTARHRTAAGKSCIIYSCLPFLEYLNKKASWKKLRWHKPFQLVGSQYQSETFSKWQTVFGLISSEMFTTFHYMKVPKNPGILVSRQDSCLPFQSCKPTLPKFMSQSSLARMQHTPSTLAREDNSKCSHLSSWWETMFTLWSETLTGIT